MKPTIETTAHKIYYHDRTVEETQDSLRALCPSADQSITSKYAFDMWKSAHDLFDVTEIVAAFHSSTTTHSNAPFSFTAWLKQIFR